MMMSDRKTKKAVVLGAGYRGRSYADYARVHPDKLEIVGVADPDDAAVARIPATRRWTDFRAAIADRPDADFLIVTLPDSLHPEAALAALDRGYHLLLEKPLAATEATCRMILAKAAEQERLVLLGHILRETPVYARIKAILDADEIGEVVSIIQQESASYAKIAHSFCRGSLASSLTSSPIILTKCSHDFDLFTWWIGRPCRRVSSFGSLQVLSSANRPARAAARCADCPADVERNCIWSAKRLYLERHELDYLLTDTSPAARARIVETSPYGRCVFACTNDVPDHQCVNLEFEGGATASLTMTGFTARNVRTTRITCTRGELACDGEHLTITRFDRDETRTETFASDATSNSSRHGGGDFNLVARMLQLLRDGDAKRFAAASNAALTSHLIAFAAERSRLSAGRVVEL